MESQVKSLMCQAFRTAEAYSRGSLCIHRQESDGSWYSAHILLFMQSWTPAHRLELPTVRVFPINPVRNFLINMPGGLSFLDPVKLMILTITIGRCLTTKVSSWEFCVVKAGLLPPHARLAPIPAVQEPQMIQNSSMMGVFNASVASSVQSASPTRKAVAQSSLFFFSFQGRVFIPKEKPVETRKEEKVTLDPELEEALASASDTELYDLAGEFSGLAHGAHVTPPGMHSLPWCKPVSCW